MAELYSMMFEVGVFLAVCNKLLCADILDYMDGCLQIAIFFVHKNVCVCI